MYDLDNGTENINIKTLKVNSQLAIRTAGTVLTIGGLPVTEELVIQAETINLQTELGVNITGVVALSGFTTAERPTTVYEGTILYDQTIKKCILYNGTDWVNLDGTALS